MKRISVVIILASLIFMAGCGSTTEKKNTVVPVRVVKAVQEDVPVTVSAPGQIVEHKQVKIMPQVTGKIKKILFTRGQHVNAGELLVQIDEEPFILAAKQAEAQVDKQKVQAALSADQYKRYKDLYKAGAISQDVYEQYNTTRNSDASGVVGAQAALEIANTNLDYCKIMAPIDGKIGDILINAGNIINANTSVIAVINQVQPIDALFSVPDRYLDEIRNAFNSREVIVQVLDENGKRLSQGRLDFIDNTVNKSAGTIALKAVFTNSDNILFPGAFINAQIELSTLKNAIVVPMSAVQNTDDGSAVYIVKEDNTVTIKKVKTEKATGSNIVIVGDVSAGDTVVTEGQLNLKEGSAVSIKS